jgi:hypothetical protein
MGMEELNRGFSLLRAVFSPTALRLHPEKVEERMALKVLSGEYPSP